MPAWPVLTGLLLAAAGGLCWLLFGLAGDTSGRVPVAEIGGVVEVLASPSPGLTAREVAALPASAWQRQTTSGFAPSASDRTAWIRITLPNPDATTRHGVLENADNHADFAACHELSGEPEEAPLLAGETVPATSKEIWGRAVAFPLTLPPHLTRTVYIEMRDHYGAWINFSWWPERRDAHAALLRMMLAEGCYFGVLLALIFYNGVLWARLRFPDTGRYLLFLASFTAYVFMARSGFSELGVPLGSPWMEGVGMAALSLSGAFLAEFARAFLDLSRVAPGADRIIRIARNLMAILAPGALIVAWSGQGMLFTWFVFASLITHLVVFAAAITAWRAGARQAQYFILAFAVLIAGVAPAFGVLFTSVSIDLVARSVMVGSALQMLLLSVATADRFAILQRDKLLAQDQLLEETAKREAIQEAYADELEAEVRERTADLAAANADKDRMIAVLGHDLRSPLTGLTQVAEHLTAHPTASRLEQFTIDAARTGRQLLLLIEDLVLWAQLRAGQRHRSTHTVAGIVAPVLTLYRTIAERQGLALQVEMPHDLRVSADLVVIQTLVRNLVANAVKCARSTVKLTASAEDDQVRIAVEDDGPGLPAHIAKQFLAEDQTEWPTTRGLGLRLCREIGHTIGTKFQIDTPSQGGTRISFILPRISQP